MYKDKIKRMLINMISSENITIIESLLELLDGLSEEELHTKFKNINITEEFLKKIIEDFKKNEEHTNDFIPVNEWFCYGRTGNTIHLHLIPKDLRGVKTELGDLGIKIDLEANNVRGKLAKISSKDSSTLLYVVPTNEELMIALDTLEIVSR